MGKTDFIFGQWLLYKGIQCQFIQYESDKRVTIDINGLWKTIDINSNSFI